MSTDHSSGPAGRYANLGTPGGPAILPSSVHDRRVAVERRWRLRTTTLEEIERSSEKKFALEQELAFRAVARRNNLLGEWAAARLGLSGPAVADYIRAIRRMHLAGAPEAEIFREIMMDFGDRGTPVSAHELRSVLQRFHEQAVEESRRHDPLR
jgi:hypothetical protein